MSPRLRNEVVLGLLGLVILGTIAGSATQTGPSSYDIEIVAPDSAAPRESVKVAAEVEGGSSIATDLRLTVSREDSGDLICQDDSMEGVSASCAGQFEMPEHNVSIHATLRNGSGELMAETRVPINVSPSSNQRLIEGLKGAVADGLTDGLVGPLKEGLMQFFLGMFEEMLSILVETVSRLLTSTPDVHPNPAVEGVHRQTLFLMYSLTGIGISAIGLLHMTGPVFGISYQQLRPLLPRLVVAAVFATVSLQLLQYAVAFTQVLTSAFAPSDLAVQELAGMGVGILLVYVVNAVLLLAVAAVFILRDVYILFVAAISPLLAFCWVFPRARRYADSFIAGWWAALLMAPLDMLVFKFLLALMEGQGASYGQIVSNWLFGVAGFVLLLFIPYQLYGASQATVGAGHHLAHHFYQTIQTHKLQQEQDRFTGLDDDSFRSSRNGDRVGQDSLATDRAYDGEVIRPESPDRLEDNRFYTEGELDEFRDEEPGGAD